MSKHSSPPTTPSKSSSMAPSHRYEELPPPSADCPSAIRCSVTADNRLCPCVQGLLDAVGNPAFLLDEQRRIVGCNHRFLQLAGVSSTSDVAGLRFGDAIACRNAREHPEGCGNTPACGYCGAAIACTASHNQGETVNRECCVALMGNNNGTLEAEVIASPLVINATPYTVVTLRDISADKRRRVLERTFFHDVLNTAGGLRGVVSMVQRHAATHPEAPIDDEYVQLLRELCDQLIELIQQQRVLLAAEANELVTQPVYVSVLDVLESVKNQHARHDPDDTHTVKIGNVPDIDIFTDHNLVRRVLENMVRNALEATPAGSVITLDAIELGDEVALRVHNPGVIPPDVSAQIFRRSFSTKGRDRGIGTYSMRLIGENYLGGKVSFTTSEQDGTVFMLRLPKQGTRLAARQTF